MINLSNVLFLIDGQSELNSFKSKFKRDFRKYPDFRIVSCNGKDVTAAGYAAKASGFILLALSKRYREIICIVDLENRSFAAIDFSIDVRNEIIQKIITYNDNLGKEITNKLNVCVPDKMFENWIVSDVQGIKVCKDLIINNARQECYDGKHGCNLLEIIMKVPYKKTRHAHVLFKEVSFKRARKNSPSFRTFCEKIKF